jgi:type III restriction enzyme
MRVIKNFITKNALDWSEQAIEDNNSIAGFILRHIESQSKLRDAQTEAIKVYLWLKSVADNKPLIDVFQKYYPDDQGDALTTLLHDIGEEIDNKKLVKFARDASDDEIHDFFVDLFGGYKKISNVLFSLPMGAGKTFVMASIVYIDLYYSLNNSDDRFAKNFLIFAPSGLKSSVIPSLRTIQEFDPSWILPADIANKIKEQLKFVVLDVAKNKKKSNRIENPNARKVQECLVDSDPSGYVFVTNAEKVILNKVVEDEYKGTLYEKNGDEMSMKENELRSQLALVPHLSILIDEVHHIQNKENKLRLVINEQFNKGNTTNIVGFTGTPYARRRMSVGNFALKLDQIPSTIYHYELKNGVRNFLKLPIIRKFESNTETIVRSALDDFYATYYDQRYSDKRKTKLAIYCSSIDRLENTILPIVTEFYMSKNLDISEILTFHESSSKDSQVEFGKLDTPYSTKRIVLLCQIGKEGWDCQSLSGVVLSGEGDSPKNMVLQTSCRCLREVDDAKVETGSIYLNQANYRHLEKELKDRHQISISDFVEGKEDERELLRIDRRGYLELPELEYNQMILEYEMQKNIEQRDPEKDLIDLLRTIADKELPYYIPETSTRREGLDMDDESSVTVDLLELMGNRLSYMEFVSLIAKSSFGAVRVVEVLKLENLIKKIYKIVTQDSYLKSGYQLDPVIRAIHGGFAPQLTVRVNEVLEPRKTSWLVPDINKNSISSTNKIYPSNRGFISKIEQYDRDRTPISKITAYEDETIKAFQDVIDRSGGEEKIARPMQEQIKAVQKSKLPITNKDRSLHYIPYEFSKSEFERKILERIYGLEPFKSGKLEVYFVGDRHISTFKIKIYKKMAGSWKLIQDNYTPDFVIVRRDGKKIEKTLVIETKGAHLAYDFVGIREFMEGAFLDNNPERFQFLYLEDGKNMSYHEQTIMDKINKYFA